MTVDKVMDNSEHPLRIPETLNTNQREIPLIAFALLRAPEVLWVPHFYAATIHHYALLNFGSDSTLMMLESSARKTFVPILYIFRQSKTQFWEFVEVGRRGKMVECFLD